MTIAFYLNQWPNSKVHLAGAWKVVVSSRPGNAAGQGSSGSIVLGGSQPNLNEQMELTLRILQYLLTHYI